MSTESRDSHPTAPVADVADAESALVIRARVLVLAVPDALDTTITLSSHGHVNLRFLSSTDEVQGGSDCTLCSESELAATSYRLAADYRPTHLIVRDGLGTHAELERCRLFLEAAISGAGESVRSVIQTHASPQSTLTATYDRWLKAESDVRPLRSLTVVWHDPLVEALPDCRGHTQRTDLAYAWRLATTPARLIDRRLRDTRSHNLEYITARKP